MHQTLRFPNTHKKGKKSLHASAFQMTTSLQESSTTSPLCCIQKVVIDGAPPRVNFHLERQNDIVLAHMMSTQQSGGEIKEKKRTKRSHHERNKTHTHWFTRGFVLLCLKAFTEQSIQQKKHHYTHIPCSCFVQFERIFLFLRDEKEKERYFFFAKWKGKWSIIRKRINNQKGEAWWWKWKVNDSPRISSLQIQSVKLTERLTRVPC